MLVAGSTAYEDPERGAIIVRLTAGGPVDLTYGDYGVARTRLSDGGLPNDVAFQPDGAAVFGVPVRSETHQRFLVARVGNDGRPDLTFGTGGELQAVSETPRTRRPPASPSPRTAASSWAGGPAPAQGASPTFRVASSWPTSSAPVPSTHASAWPASRPR